MPKKNDHPYYTKYLTITLSNGTKKPLKFYGKTEKEAIEKRAKAKAEYDAGILIFNDKTTFQRWYTEWFQTCLQSSAGKGQCVNIEHIIRNFFLPTLGSMHLSEIKPIHIRQCLNLMEGMSKDYISKGYNSIKAIFREAVANDLINKDPTFDLKRPKAAEKVDRRPLTEEERKQLKEAIPHHNRGAFFGIMLACGLRPGEARALTWFNVNMKSQELTVTQAVETMTLNVKSPKSKSGKRTIPIPDWYMPCLLNLERTDSPYVFPGENHNVISQVACQRSWHSFVREIDIRTGAKLYRNQIIMHVFAQDLEPYNLRHTYCTELAEKGVDLRTAQYLMGHSDIKMTANIYSHVTNKLYEKARELINQ